MNCPTNATSARHVHHTANQSLSVYFGAIESIALYGSDVDYSRPAHSVKESKKQPAAQPSTVITMCNHSPVKSALLFFPVATAVCLLLTSACPVFAQSPVPQSVTTPAQASADLPEAPQPKLVPQSAQPPVPWLWGRMRNSGKPLTTEQKFRFYAIQTFGPPAVFSPAFGAATRMANPPSDYPTDWKDGAGAFGRLYGSTLATQTSKHTAEFLAEAAFHYDARYAPSKSDWKLARVAHAVGFVFVEKTDSGKPAFALPHFAGAAAGGFVGMADLPPGYNTLAKAGQRTGSEFGQIAIRNLAQEFAPELAPIARFIRLPKIIPVWWTPIHPSQQP